jgi:AcrR family transcriptional regulator
MSTSSLSKIEKQIKLYKHGKVPKELRIAQIVETAKIMFADFGYTNSSMDELAKRVKVSKPVIYELVVSKENLFKILLDEAGKELHENIQTAVDACESLDNKLRSGGLAFFNFVKTHQPLWLALFVNDQGLFNKEINLIREEQAELVANLIFSSNAFTGVTPAYIDGIAHALNGAYEALARWWFEHPDIEATTLANWIVELLLPAISLANQQF